MIDIFINGEAEQCPLDATLQDLTEALAEKQRRFAVAINDTFVPSALYGETRLQAGDRIELLTPMVGG